MKEFLVVGNLKTNMLVKDISNYLNVINSNIENKNVVICPTSIYTPYFLKHGYSVGLQNIFFKNGSFTGEITPMQAANMGIEYVIVGHSDRRIYFGETESDINKKILECLKYGLKVILCVGETNEEKNMLKTTKVLKKQLTFDLRNVESLENVYIAYEPIWAIGTNITPDNRDIKEAISYIQNIVNKQIPNNEVKVLYGGSVNSETISSIKEVENLYGIMVGTATSDPNEFLKIIKEVMD